MPDKEDELGKVVITVTARTTGKNYLARSYPDDDIDNNGKVELYETPVYRVFVDSLSGVLKCKSWNALRFMPYWNDPNDLDPHYSTKGWVNSGLHSVARKKVMHFNKKYTTSNRFSPNKGAFQIRDSFLIHAGPNSLAESGWGAAGCVEIIGDFTQFKRDICTVAGINNALDVDITLEKMVRAGKLFVEVENAKPPNLKSNFLKEI